MKETITESIKKALLNGAPRRPAVAPGDYLSSGITPLNLALSGSCDGGYPKGRCVYYVGDSESGKTWVTMSAVAEACRNPRFKDYELIYDGTEYGALMDVAYYFGETAAKKLRPPRGTRKNPVYSTMVEGFYYNLYNALKKGPCLYILDSMDALDTKDDEEKFLEMKEAAEKGKPAKGSYGMAKAKINSQWIKRFVTMLAETGSILFLISQARDKVAPGLPFPVKTRAGGRALRYYAHVELWTSVKSEIKTPDKRRILGSNIKVSVEKNRLNGWHGDVYFPFLRDYGIDDIGACVDLLADEGHWAKTDSKIAAPEFDLNTTRNKLIESIDEQDSYRELQLLCQRVWRENEAKYATRIKRRYE